MIGGRFHLVDLIGSGPQILPENHAVLVGLALVGEAAVHLLDLEGDAGEGLVGLPVPLHQTDAGEGGVDEINHNVLVLFGIDPDGFSVIRIQNVVLYQVRNYKITG